MFHIKELREAKGLNMREAAQLLGLPYTTYVNYEKGLREPTSETLIQIADFFETSIDYLVGRKPINESQISDVNWSAVAPNLMPMPQMRKIPLLGSIACGAPILADEHIEGYVDIPDHIDAQFTLRCKGDSMINARIYDGDIVYIRQQEEVNNGEIAAVLVNDEATLKRVKFHPDRIILEPANPLYDPLVYRGEEMNSVHILGKAVAFTSTIR